jgi:hypothetical protein
MFGIKLGRTATSLDFTSASENAPSPDIIMAYAGIASKRAVEGNYSEAKRLLGMTKLPANVEHNLITYMALIHELVLILDSLKPRLERVQALIAEGAVAQARENSTEIEGMMAEASRRLDLLFSSLDSIHTIYRIDTGSQGRDLETLSGTLLSFEQVLLDLKDELEAMDQLAATQLDLRVYPSPVHVEGSLDIWGELQSGGVGLGGRVVELWVNGIQIANPTLDQLGRFDWQYTVSNGSRAGKLEVYARYSPIGEDLSRFRPAKSATVTVPVEYHSVVLTIFASSKRVLVLENFSVQGQLADAFGNPLAGKTVDLLADGEPVNSSVTDSAGKYSIDASLSAETPEGEHQLHTRFDPKQGIHAFAASESIAIQLYYLKPIISQLVLTGVVLIHGELVAVSGQMVELKGCLEIDSKPYEQGLLIAFLGSQELGRTLSRADGVFRLPISIPPDASDENTISVIVVPATPWVARTTASIVVRVLNSVVMGLAIAATVFAVLVFSGRSIDPRSILQRRAVPRRRPETETVTLEKPEVQEKEVPVPTTLPLSDFRLELQLGLKSEEPRAFVKMVYWEIRRMLAEVLAVGGQPSETPREYDARVADNLGAAAPSLSALTQLFEVAEYSQHTISRLEVQEGINHAVRVAEEMNARIKT